MAYKFQLEGVKYELDVEGLLISELEWLERQTGMNPQEFFEGLSQTKPNAVRGLVWFAKKRAGDEMPGKFTDLDFPLMPFLNSLEDDEVPADESVPTPDVEVVASL